MKAVAAALLLSLLAAPAIGQAPPRVIDGQTLHPVYQTYLDGRAKEPNGPEKRARQRADLLDPDRRERFRAAVDRNWAARSLKTPAIETRVDRRIPGPGGDIPVRIYRPTGPSSGPLPVLVYMHGGGWLMPRLDGVEPAAALIAQEARVIVVSVDYRLAPEHKFPAAHDDVSAAFDWTLANAASLGGDPARVGIGGDSAGGNMAVWLSLDRAMSGKPAPAAQLIYYPVLDQKVERYRSFALFSEGYTLDRHFAKLAQELTFASPKDMERLGASPLRARSFKGVAPAIVATAGFDMLRDQGRIYAERLVRDGVDVTYVNYPSLIHGFMQFSGAIDDAEAACVETARDFGALIRRRRP